MAQGLLSIPFYNGRRTFVIQMFLTNVSSHNEISAKRKEKKEKNQ
jgi:hypothetical protein